MAIPAYYSLLQRGSSGPDVALVQTWLNGVRDACTWYGELKTDGKFGISTENAVKEFQLKNKMNVDGKVAERVRRGIERQRTRLQAAEIQQFVDQTCQALRLVDDHLHRCV